VLKGLVDFSLRFRGVVTILAAVTVAYGTYVSLHARLDVFPEFAPPQVVIQCEAPGLSPEETEALVTRPIEAAVNGVAGLASIRSQSVHGLSVVTIVFKDGTDLFRARQMVGERLSEASGRIPQGAEPPKIEPLTSSASMVYVLGLTSEQRSLMDVRTFADWTVKPRLLGLPGVAKVVTFGGEVREVQVQVKPDRLLAYDLTLEDVLAAVREATGVRGSGFIDSAAQRINIRVEGQPVSAAELGEAVAARREGLSVRLKDIGRVVEAAQPKLGDGAIEGKPGVLLVVSGQFGSNTMEVTEAIEQAVEQLGPAFASEKIRPHPGLFRPATFIERSLKNVGFSLLVGSALVAGVLFLFLFSLRTAFISLTAIPLSLLAAVIVLDRFGATLNTITLGGLVIAIGEVVDDAIIDVENIVRRLRENQAAASQRPVLAVILDASLEVRSAVVYATFVVALVFVPVLTMSDLQGRLFAPLGIAYVLAVLASLLVALTVTPALSALLLRGRLRTSDPPFAAWLKARYDRMLRAVSARPRTLIAAALVLCVGAAATIPFFGGAFLPEFLEGHFIVHMSMVPGTSLEESLRLGREVAHELRKNPKIRSVAQHAGRAEDADDTWGSHYSEFQVGLVELDGEEAEMVVDEIRAALTRFPGAYFVIMPFLTERIEETLSGVSAPVAVKIFGEDLDVLDRLAREVEAALRGVRGAVDVSSLSRPGQPELLVRLRPDRLRQFGVRPVSVMDAVQTAYRGTAAAQAYPGNRVVDVSVILEPEARRDPEEVGSLLLRGADGERVPLRELSEIGLGTGRTVVEHDGTQRRQAVTCGVRGRDVASFVAEAREAISARVSFPQGCYPVFTGSAEAREKAQGELLLWSSIAGVGVVLLLAIAFGDLRNLLLVLANLPFALVGGVLAVFASGGWLSVGSLVGFVTLFGITTRNSIMMVSHFEHLVDVEGRPWTLETALRGASERLVPVLMTATVTALGLLPMAIGTGEAGREIEGPLAIVILGGLATSTFLNLLVLPTLALRYGRFGERKAS
jgi:CzcA family heavy metal efflux pump